MLFPPAIARAKGTHYTEDDVINFLRAEHAVEINQTFVLTDCSPAIADLRAKEITYSGTNHSEAKFGVTRFDIAKAMTPAEICDDVKSLLRQIQELCP